MNNNILHFCAVSQTFTSQVMQMLRLQLAPAEPVPTCGGAGLFSGDKLSSTRQEGLFGPFDLCVQMHRLCSLLQVQKAFSTGQEGRVYSEEYVMSQVRRAISGRKRFRAQQPWLRSPLSHIFFHFSFPLSLSLSGLLLSVCRFPQQQEHKIHYLAFKELNGETFSVHSCSAFNLFLQSRYISNQELERVASG